MRALLRLALTLAIVGAATLLLVPWHWLALRTGWASAKTAPRLWNRTVLRALGWRVRVEGAPAQARPLMIAANHVSWSDIVIISAFAEVTFVAKSEVNRWPLFGLLARLQDTVFIDRDNRRNAAAQAAQMGERLRRGEALVLFPEGTTADGNSLLPFKTSLFGALETALREEGAALMQPLALAYTGLYGLPMSHAERDTAAWTGDRGLLEHLRLLARRGPLDVSLIFGEPVALTSGIGRKAIAAQAESEVRRMMAAALRGR